MTSGILWEARLTYIPKEQGQPPLGHNTEINMIIIMNTSVNVYTIYTLYIVGIYTNNVMYRSNKEHLNYIKWHISYNRVLVNRKKKILSASPFLPKGCKGPTISKQKKTFNKDNFNLFYIKLERKFYFRYKPTTLIPTYRVSPYSSPGFPKGNSPS